MTSPLRAPAEGRPGWVELEPEPTVHMDEYAAQTVLQRTCPVCFAEAGFSCTVPVEVDWRTMRQQVLEFHPERVA